MLYLKICLLFFAGDTVIMTKTPDDLQKALDELHVYCSQSMETKCKFSKKNPPKILVFHKTLSIKILFITIITLLKL